MLPLAAWVVLLPVLFTVFSILNQLSELPSTSINALDYLTKAAHPSTGILIFLFGSCCAIIAAFPAVPDARHASPDDPPVCETDVARPGRTTGRACRMCCGIDSGPHIWFTCRSFTAGVLFDGEELRRYPLNLIRIMPAKGAFKGRARDRGRALLVFRRDAR